MAKLNIDHFCIDDVLRSYAERDMKRKKKLEKKNKKKEEKTEGKLVIDIQI
ncbi:hypothetical protein [Romboutsia ilealis]|uniref:hypothetical protein n=1 Tax=Romboutsia ilealis TaxID=1115758 RepID=UPI00272CE729|nr:hypothetical protein [Romboutsia ilealis]